MISFSKNGVIRGLIGCYGNEHLNSHILEFKKCITRYLLLKSINNKYLCQNNELCLWYEGTFKTNSKFKFVHCCHGNKSRKDQTAEMVVFIMFWTIFLEREMFSSNLWCILVKLLPNREINRKWKICDVIPTLYCISVTVRNTTKLFYTSISKIKSILLV